MKSAIPFALLLFLGACQSPVEQQKAVVAPIAGDTASTKSATTPLTARASTISTGAVDDTLRFSNKLILRVSSGSKTDFAILPTEPKQAINETYLIQHQADGRVRREGNALLLTLNNKKLVIFKNDTYKLRGDENEEADKQYQYGGNLPGLPYWIVEETLYEAHHTLLVNQQTGVSTSVDGDLELSPDHTHLFTSYAGLVYDDDVSTLQLFAINQQKVFLIGRKELPAWAPGRIRWLDNRTVAVEQLRVDDDSADINRRTYIRILLP